jgi:uncharacterized protein (PEP-CTERM system associated)
MIARHPFVFLVVPAAAVSFVMASIPSGYAQSAAPGLGVGSGVAGCGAGGAGTSSEPNAIGAAPGGNNETPAPLRLTGTHFAANGEVCETYVTNGLGLPSAVSPSKAKDDFISTLGLSLGAHDHTLRFDGDLDYRLLADFYPHHGYDRMSNYLQGLAIATLVPEHLFLRARASAAPILINEIGPVGADSRFVASGPNSGIRNSYGYTVYPNLMFRLGDFASSNTILSQSGYFFTRPSGGRISETIPGIGTPPRQVLRYSGSEAISSGEDFTRLNWSLVGTAAKTVESTLNLVLASGAGTVKYAVSRSFHITALGGYESITSNQPLGRSLVGPIVMGGFEYAPDPNFQVSASAGSQFNRPSYIGSLYYRFGAFTSLSGSATDTVTTPGGGLLNRLGSLGVNGAGQFYDTGLPLDQSAQLTSGTGLVGFDPNGLGGTPLLRSVNRYRRASLSLLQQSDRTQYRLTGFYTQSDTLTRLTTGLPRTGNATGATFDISRNMTQNLVGSISGTYERTNYFSADYRIALARISLNYSISPLTQIFGRATYYDRALASGTALSPVGGDLSDASVTIGLRRQLL